MIIGWSLYYLFASFTSELPWQKCRPEWSTPSKSYFHSVYIASLVSAVGSAFRIAFVRCPGPAHSLAGERINTEYWLTAWAKYVKEKCGYDN